MAQHDRLLHLYAQRASAKRAHYCKWAARYCRHFLAIILEDKRLRELHTGTEHLAQARRRICLQPSLPEPGAQGVPISSSEGPMRTSTSGEAGTAAHALLDFLRVQRTINDTTRRGTTWVELMLAFEYSTGLRADTLVAGPTAERPTLAAAPVRWHR